MTKKDSKYRNKDNGNRNQSPYENDLIREHKDTILQLRQLAEGEYDNKKFAKVDLLFTKLRAELSFRGDQQITPTRVRNVFKVFKDEDNLAMAKLNSYRIAYLANRSSGKLRDMLLDIETLIHEAQDENQFDNIKTFMEAFLAYLKTA